jgi:hypothetical protein
LEDGLLDSGSPSIRESDLNFHAGGPWWTRTTGLGLIRTAL